MYGRHAVIPEILSGFAKYQDGYLPVSDSHAFAFGTRSECAPSYKSHWDPPGEVGLVKHPSRFRFRWSSHIGLLVDTRIDGYWMSGGSPVESA